MQTLLLSLVLAVGLQMMPQDQPRASQGLYAITNARIETVTNGTIENGTIVVRGDRIEAIGPDIDIPSAAQIIDAGGRSVYPGMIDSGTRLGLTEIGSVAETSDYAEIGSITPQMEALTAVNPNTSHIPVTRVSGVTTVLTAPGGGLLPGVAATINLIGYTPEQMHTGARFMVLNFPPGARQSRRDRRSDEEIAKASKKNRKELDDLFDEAELYDRILTADAAGKGDRTPEFVPEVRALIPVVRGELPLLINVGKAGDIEDALEWTERRGLSNVILSGVQEGWRVADLIADAGIPCIVGPVLSTPVRDSDRYDKAYANAGLLVQAGVKVAIQSGESENVRNLPFNAGFAAAYGLGKEEALKAVTINAAEIMGIDADYGSLEVGKKANLLLADGDPFEPATEISEVFIDGFRVPIDSRQIQLYLEFLDRDSGRLRPVEIVPPVRN